MQNLRGLLAEALVLGFVGLGLAVCANALSSRGLSLSRNYFERAGPNAAARDATNVVSAATNALTELKARLSEKGLSLIEGPEAEKFFRDPQYEQELVIFVDARDDRHYEEGHVPGAYQFDRYYPEKYLPTVLPACLSASKIVVYCTGGKCEDSEFATVMLAEAGVPAANISVYGGGITDWTERKLPLEIGPRKSGNLKP
jgi:rhodanese-related sulfurtransferase